ncbi:MAG: hypothetical protein MJZ46_04060 [Bacteroidales bacterium]|nr:hypothetical protein [Bacteroidales bacterium]
MYHLQPRGDGISPRCRGECGCPDPTSRLSAFVQMWDYEGMFSSRTETVVSGRGWSKS